MQLDVWPMQKTGRIASIDWSLLGEAEGQRLRDLGFEPGAEIEPLHKGSFFFRDPLAVRIGRMTVAIRASLAAAVSVEPL